MMSLNKDIRIVVGLDFGVRYSTFAYAHKSNPSDIIVYNHGGNFKIPTVLKYDESFNLVSWGYSALCERPNRRRNKSTDIRPIENFLLFLSKREVKPFLPHGLDYKKAITDYLREMNKVMKEAIDCWSSIDFFSQVLFVMTISDEYDDNALCIMRECAYKAGIINDMHSPRLVFITKHEASCISMLKEFNISVGTLFMVVDCGSSTVDLISRRLLEGQKLYELTERNGDYCGGKFVDDEFIKFLGHKVGLSAINLVKKQHYSQFQYIVQEFCKRVKFLFTGQKDDFMPFDLDFDELCPVITQCVVGLEREELEEQEWTIELTFEDVKAMFDPVIERILRLIRSHRTINDCKTIFLVGGFSQSKYLQARIKQEFDHKINNINVPENLFSLSVRGAVQYGLMHGEPEPNDAPRVFNKTYGIKVTRKWNHGDPIKRKLSDGMINVFLRIAKRGDEIPIKGISIIVSSSFISRNSLELYATNELDVEYCDSPGVNLICKHSIYNNIMHSKDATSITLIFGNMGVKVIAQNVKTGCKSEVNFILD